MILKYMRRMPTEIGWPTCRHNMTL
jgi:hypothetical protein